MQALERETRTSGPNPLFRALIVDSGGDDRATLDAWLDRLVRREARIADPSAIKALATQGRTADALSRAAAPNGGGGGL